MTITAVRRSSNRGPNRLLTRSVAGAPGEIRTPNLLIRSQMLYPLSYGCSVLAGSGLRTTPGESSGPRRAHQSKSCGGPCPLRRTRCRRASTTGRTPRYCLRRLVERSPKTTLGPDGRGRADAGQICRAMGPRAWGWPVVTCRVAARNLDRRRTARRSCSAHPHRSRRDATGAVGAGTEAASSRLSAYPAVTRRGGCPVGPRRRPPAARRWLARPASRPSAATAPHQVKDTRSGVESGPGVAGQAHPASRFANPDLGHGHPVQLPSRTHVDVVCDDATQNRRVAHRDDFGLPKPLTVPATCAPSVGPDVARTVEHLSLVGGPREARMQQQLQPTGVTPSQGSRPRFSCRDYLLSNCHALIRSERSGHGALGWR